jgi:hypothetical protein
VTAFLDIQQISLQTLISKDIFPTKILFIKLI